jgi:cell division protein FtsI/penicillin-binding protein 2
MAELHVRHKRASFLWLWVILIISLIAAALYYYVNYYQKQNQKKITNRTTLVHPISESRGFSV